MSGLGRGSLCNFVILFHFHLLVPFANIDVNSDVLFQARFSSALLVAKVTSDGFAVGSFQMGRHVDNAQKYSVATETLELGGGYNEALAEDVVSKNRRDVWHGAHVDAGVDVAEVADLAGNVVVFLG